MRVNYEARASQPFFRFQVSLQARYPSPRSRSPLRALTGVAPMERGDLSTECLPRVRSGVDICPTSSRFFSVGKKSKLDAVAGAI